VLAGAKDAKGHFKRGHVMPLFQDQDLLTEHGNTNKELVRTRAFVSRLACAKACPLDMLLYMALIILFLDWLNFVDKDAYGMVDASLA